MTSKQRLFAEGIRAGLTGREAAARAGYARGSEWKAARRNLSRPEIRDAVGLEPGGKDKGGARSPAQGTAGPGKIKHAEAQKSGQAVTMEDLIGRLMEVALSPDGEQVRTGDRLKALELAGKYLAANGARAEERCPEVGDEARQLLRGKLARWLGEDR